MNFELFREREIEEENKRHVRNIILPYRAKIVRDKGLPENSWLLLKVDVHYSHRSEDFLRFCDENRVAVLFVPPCCTDIRQEMDTVVNRPFKVGVKEYFSAFKTFNG